MLSINDWELRRGRNEYLTPVLYRVLTASGEAILGLPLTLNSWA